MRTLAEFSRNLLQIYVSFSIYQLKYNYELLANCLASGFPKCSANDPNFKQCTTKAANDARPFLVNGIPELGVPSVDPLFVTQVVLKSGSQAVNVEVVLSNNTVRGLGRYVVSNLEY